MRKSIDTYIKAIAHDNEQEIRENYMTVADYIINDAENNTGYYEFFDDDIEVLQRYDLLEERLEQLKPGEYTVCVNYKKKGVVELRTKARTTDHLKMLAKVTKEDKNTKAALHRFAVKVREAYQSGIVIIGKTHALRGFGKRIVAAAPCIKESQNTYYSSSAPRQYYDKNTLVYMKLEQTEKNDK